MAQREIFHLPSAVLEVDFAGDEARAYDLKTFRSGLKEKLMKCLVSDGVAFEERREAPENDWKGMGDTLVRVEGVVDSWVLANHFRCSKAKDRHSRKALWELECGEERVTILMMPEEQGMQTGRAAGGSPFARM
ncbi:MAG TPA: hypothetical protein VG733_13120 [Chthoniobacteraceae bacterium]|nr:hypothetical protein [Chthoniobacteraceae bacterium]